MNVFLPGLLTIEIETETEGGPGAGSGWAQLLAKDWKDYPIARGGCDLAVQPSKGAVQIKRAGHKISIQIELELRTRQPKKMSPK